MKSLGVCSWSLQPATPRELAERVTATGIEAVQLALDPIRCGAWKLDDTVAALAAAGVRVLSGMMEMEGEDYSTLESIRRTGGVRPLATWKANLAAAHANARLASELELSLVTLHAGFLPEDARDPERGVLLERLGALIDAFDARGVDVAFETGQETAATLLEVLADLDRARAGVNFDPANMLLYGQGDPVEALALLQARVHQIHVKDGLRAKEPGTWGEEVRVGTGEVDWTRFLALADTLAVDFVIEREAGTQRIEDVRAAASLVRRHVEVGE
ncbi:MAG: sugar phosphate isomerase/epimerase family protein [Planctomycetota bacterium]